MKKIITLLLLIGGFACAASAGNVTKRIYVITDNNFQQFKHGGLSLHAWYTTGGDIYTSSENMSTYDGFNVNAGNCVWFKDITFDETKSIKFFVYDWSNTGWHSSDGSQQEVNSSSNSYYTWNSTDNGALSVAGTVKYYAYLYDGSTWTEQELTSEDGAIFSATIDNQTSHNENLEVIIASSVGLNNSGAFGNYIWNTMFRPFAENQTPGFSNQIDFDGGCWGGNSNSLKLSVSAKYVLSYKPYEWKYSLEPYIERTLNPAAEGYATFSSAYNVIPGEGLTAKYASAVDASGRITWTEYPSTGIAANQGALLIGTAGKTYKFTPATSASAPSPNFLKPIIEKTQLTDKEGDNTNYILTKVGSGPLAFYKVNANRSWCSAGTAYLSTSATSARGYFSLWEDATSIEGIATESENENLPVYDLQGRRVTSPQKGLYIVNGKKVVIK